MTYFVKPDNAVKRRIAQNHINDSFHHCLHSLELYTAFFRIALSLGRESVLQQLSFLFQQLLINNQILVGIDIKYNLTDRFILL